MLRVLYPLIMSALILSLGVGPSPVHAEDLDGAPFIDGRAPLSALRPKLHSLANHVPGLVAMSVLDLRRGDSIGINADRNLPAASIIKIPVMVEVFRQIALGKFSLRRTVSVTSGDRDWGFGKLCGAPQGSAYSVRNLLWLMVTQSDNTATNMLIRLVGRANINETMNGFGFNQTWLGDIIHSDGDVRELRTSANDMMRLLWMIAERRLVNAKACNLMLQIMLAQHHNTLLPVGLPKGMRIAHKTGTLHDTLNDVGFVELRGSPYIICVLTTHLTDLNVGERFIRIASRITFESFARGFEAAN